LKNITTIFWIIVLILNSTIENRQTKCSTKRRRGDYNQEYYEDDIEVQSSIEKGYELDAYDTTMPM
jgi:hypothetical protein